MCGEPTVPHGKRRFAFCRLFSGTTIILRVTHDQKTHTQSGKTSNFGQRYRQRLAVAVMAFDEMLSRDRGRVLQDSIMQDGNHDSSPVVLSKDPLFFSCDSLSSSMTMNEPADVKTHLFVQLGE
jgi:hypothetical protein